MHHIQHPHPTHSGVDLTEGNITGHLIRFALPLLAGNIFQQLYNMVDTWVVGNFVSNEAFSAVGTVGPIVNMLIGCFLGTQFAGYIESIDHWIAFVLLALIGGNMIREAAGGEEEDVDGSYAPLRMLPLAVATAIDALAVGVTFAFLGTDIWTAVAMIGATTFVLSAAGVRIGSAFGEKYASRAELAGGALLIFMGARILLSHLGVL